MNDVFTELRKRGYQARAVSIQHLPTLQDDVKERYKQGLFDNEFYETRLAWFNFASPKDFAASSLIVMAVPRPQTQATFKWKGESYPLIVPPTYTAYDEITKATAGLLSELLERKGYRTAGTRLPLKLLAVRSGLSQYGRNNITYVSGMGSFLQLVAVYSDLPCRNDTWQELAMMKACEKCHLCREACPSGAISSDRFLLRAERCIVYRNEKPGNVPFPDWMKSSWHNCLIGCMLCQRACPMDRKFLNWVEDKQEFSEEETTLILEGAKLHELPNVIVTKLKNLSLAEDIDRLPRNLAAFFEGKLDNRSSKKG
jgi:epoxyqueuosine reductase